MDEAAAAVRQEVEEVLSRSEHRHRQCLEALATGALPSSIPRRLFVSVKRQGNVNVKPEEQEEEEEEVVDNGRFRQDNKLVARARF